ncbi:MAG TPA: DUF4430 domain-containing protein [Solirubrobacteraceae bacterium]|jgi:hypothetical protein
MTSRRARLALLLAAVVAVAPAGCGLGAGEEGSGEVRVRVSEGFGAERVSDRSYAGARKDETVLRLLERSNDVETRFGGGFVQAIEGRAGGREQGRRVDWFYYVNGIEAGVGAAERRLHAGDRVWWDLHDWGAAMRVPAVVGSFPEPFISGAEGKRIPVRIECADIKGRECDEVVERLEKAGVKRTSRAILSQFEQGEVLRVLVGRWEQLRLDPVASRIGRGPQQSGVYARFDKSGRRLDVLDPQGRVARSLGAGAGLVAATASSEGSPVWVVTGTDVVGLAAAAAALETSVLDGRFAVAIENGQPIRVPDDEAP